jgi:hypothetical protein
MAFREPNEVRWVGVRPAHKGTQVLINGSSVNQVTTIYTVSAGKTLYINSYMLGVSSVATGYVYLWVATPAGELFTRLAIIWCQASTTVPCAIACLHYPIEVPAGYLIRLSSTAAGLTAIGEITGWEE